MNVLTGEKIVHIGGQDYVLRFTWRALSEVEQKYGDSPNLFDPEVIAVIAAIGLRDRHPEMTTERIMELSPPLVPFAKAVQTAIQWAYFGPEEMPKDDDRGLKKNQRAGGSWRRFVTRLWPAFLRRNSGG